MTHAFAPQRSHSVFALVFALGSALSACSNDEAGTDSGPTPELTELIEGQSEFRSAPPRGSQQRGPGLSDGAATGSGGSGNNAGPQAGGTKTERKVEETDLYRLDGDRLYYLNQYRGLMVFDVTDVDHPKLLGRSPIYGSPVQMVVREGIASVVVADWYGAMDDGTPFHGSIVRGIDARDPANMRVVGEAQLGGWVRDTRVVGDVLYAVTEKYPWDSGWYEGSSAATTTGGPTTAQVSVTSVNFAGGDVTTIDAYDVPGSGGVFNVTPDSILFASDVPRKAVEPGYPADAGRSELRYLDISDPGGSIVERGKLLVPGSVQSWGADGGRWNIDFADGKTAHVVASSYDDATSSSVVAISTADFTDPDAPIVTGTLKTPMPGWDATARFDGNRLYLSPTNWGCSYVDGVGPSGTVQTPLSVYDLSDGANPKLLGSATIAGQISLMIPNGDRLFALGNHYDCGSSSASPIALEYFDVTDPTKPKSLGSAEFGKGWAWTPAAGTFKAFTKNDAEGLVVLPFSGWDYSGYGYNNGLQLIEFTPESIASSGTAKTSGWVERGIFVKNRLVSLSNLALTVVDYTDHEKPSVVTELTLARNVVSAKPIDGDKLVELSNDFWENDANHSELRVLPLAQAEENVSDATLGSVSINGTSPSVFHDGDLSYIVSNVRKQVPCPVKPGQVKPVDPSGAEQQCLAWTNEVQVVDTSNGGAKLRGKIELPDQGLDYYYNWGWGWGGCGVSDWYYGSNVVQVDGNKLVFRRWQPVYDEAGTYVDGRQSLFVVDASKPDELSVASTVVTREQNGWWGNLRAVGDTLYASHYEWHEEPTYDSVSGVSRPGVVRYYIDQIDLSDAANPRIARKINVPGFLVGASEDDPSLIYTMNYRWDGQRTTNQLAVLKLQGDRAYLQGHVEIPGYTGNVFVRGSTAYLSAEGWEDTNNSYQVRLYQLDLSDPKHPSVQVSEQAKGWGWLLGVEGDRAFVTSGWSQQGVDIFKLAPGKAPAFEQFVRTRGWWTSSLARQDDTVLLASGYWGTQVVTLK